MALQTLDLTKGINTARLSQDYLVDDYDSCIIDKGVVSSLLDFSPLLNFKGDLVRKNTTSFYVLREGETQVSILDIANYETLTDSFVLSSPYTTSDKIIIYANYFYILQNNVFYTFIDGLKINIPIPVRRFFIDVFVINGIFVLQDNQDSFYYSSPTRLAYSIPDFAITSANLAGSINLDNSPIIGYGLYNAGFIAQTRNGLYKISLNTNSIYILQKTFLGEFFSSIKPASNFYNVLLADHRGLYLYSGDTLVSITNEKFSDFFGQFSKLDFENCKLGSLDNETLTISIADVTYLYNGSFIKLNKNYKSLFRINQPQPTTVELLSELKISNSLLNTYFSKSSTTFLGVTEAGDIGFFLQSSTPCIKMSKINIPSFSSGITNFKKTQRTIGGVTNIRLVGQGDGIITIKGKVDTSSQKTYTTKMNAYTPVTFSGHLLDLEIYFSLGDFPNILNIYTGDF